MTCSLLRMRSQRTSRRSCRWGEGTQGAGCMLIRETVQLHKVGERGRSCYKLCLSPGLLPHDASKQLSNCPPPNPTHT
jgi:hypothetical protein